ncbi:MAG: SLBB domain-containing protein, partial [Promethearchaeota archaeon]
MGEVSLKQRFILEKVINPEDYIIGPGDEFYIMIVTDISFDYRTRVNPNGYIVLPGVGKFRLAGMNLKDGVEKVVDIIKNNGYKEAKIIVVLSDIRNFKVQILGAINKPGIYTITPVIRLSELIDQAGGFNNLAKQNEILIFNNNNEVDTVDFTMYLLTGDQENNPFLKECKMIFIPFGSVDSECVEVRGEVYNQGYYVVKNNETLNDFLLRLVNVKPTADLSKVLIRRKVSSEREIIQVSSDNFDDFILQPGDEVDILAMEGVTVLGYVKLPRKYGYIPGLTAHDYIGIAGGVTEKGSLNKVTVIRK